MTPLALCLPFIVTALLLLFCRKPRRSAIFGKPIMTQNEREFFERLMYALPGYYVFAQVSFGALLDTNAGWEVRRTFAMKMADYVVYDLRSGQVVAVIELDDKTHDRAKDAKRDAMLHAAGYKTIRWHSRAKPDHDTIRKTIAGVCISA